MADIAKPSSPPLSASKNGTIISENSHKAKPEKPDEQLYEDAIAKAEREYTAAGEKVHAIIAKINNAQNPSKDSSAGKRKQELRWELESIIKQRSALNSSRFSLYEKIAALDAQLKSYTAEQNAARSRVSFKNVQEVDAEIQRLEKQVDAGAMKLVDGKKALEEISTLLSQRKGFADFDAAQKGIEDANSQLREIYKLIQSLDNQRAKAEDEINQERAKVRALWDERMKLRADYQEKHSALKAIKDEYYQARTAYREYEREQRLQRAERQKAERDAYLMDKRRKIAQNKLEEASEPAYYDEISAAEGLIRYFDPLVLEEAKAPRSVVGSDFRGTTVRKKEEGEDNYFMGTGGKKAKKGKRGNATSSPAPSTLAERKFNLSVKVIEGFSKVGLEPPLNQAGVPEVVKKLEQKRDQWEKDQPIKTKENIQKAQKEIDRLEAEGEGRYVESSRFDPVRDTSPEEFAVNQLDKDVAIEEPSAGEGILANELTEAIIPMQDFDLTNQLSSIEHMNQRILRLMTDFEDICKRRYNSITQFLREASTAFSLGPLLTSSNVSDYWNRFWEPSLVSGKTRIRWTCQCGKMLWDDFEELRPGAAENLRRDLDSFKGASLGKPHGLTPQAAGSNSPQIPPPVYAPASNLVSTVPASVLGTSSGSNPGTSSGSTAGATASAASPGSTPTVEKGNFLLLCSSKPNDTLRLSQLDLGNINDDVRLFRRLNEVYTENRGEWTRFFSLRKIKAINFRKFERHPRERVVICFCPNIHDILPWPTNPRACHPQHSPPGCNTAYDIEPTPPDLSPYVGRNGLHHLLKHPHQAAEEGNNLPIQNVWLKRFPKKKTKLKPCPKYQYGLGWGIEFEEGWDMTRVKAVISVWMLAAIIFLACWWAIHGDVQGATGMASLLLGFPALVITASSLRELEMAYQS